MCRKCEFAFPSAGVDDVAEEAKLNEIDAEVVTIVEEFEKDSEWDKEGMKEIELQ